MLRVGMIGAGWVTQHHLAGIAEDYAAKWQAMADIYFAHTARRRANQARSVVGGFYMKLLADQLACQRAEAFPNPRK